MLIVVAVTMDSAGNDGADVELLAHLARINAAAFIAWFFVTQTVSLRAR